MRIKAYTVSKNSPTLASCIFDKHGLILTIFGKQHQHTFRNDILSLSLHFYLLCLLLNSCDGNDAFWLQSMLVKQFSAFSRKHRTLSLQICVRQTIRLTTKFVDWCRTCVHCTNPCPRHQPLWPATWSSASLTRGQECRKMSSTKQLSTEKAVTCKHEGKMTSFWTSAKLKPALFRANTLHNRLFSEPPTVYRGKHVFLRHFRRSYLKAKRKVEYVYHFWKWADAATKSYQN